MLPFVLPSKKFCACRLGSNPSRHVTPLLPFPDSPKAHAENRTMAARQQLPDHRDEPTYWFAVLEIARDQGDFETAAEAQQQLRRLGVWVRYQRPRKAEGGAHAPR